MEDDLSTTHARLVRYRTDTPRNLCRLTLKKRRNTMRTVPSQRPPDGTLITNDKEKEEKKKNCLRKKEK